MSTINCPSSNQIHDLERESALLVIGFPKENRGLDQSEHPPTPEENTMSSSTVQIIESIANAAKNANVFGAIESSAATITLQAWNAAEPACYRVYLDGDSAIVELATKDRWLSESIEAELVESGDKLDELIEDELVDLGYPEDSGAVAFEHYRSDDLEFVFRSKVVPMNGQDQSEACLQWLLAYEQCFRQLGDMDESDDE